jgi:hypothetical protein
VVFLQKNQDWNEKDEENKITNSFFPDGKFDYVIVKEEKTYSKSKYVPHNINQYYLDKQKKAEGNTKNYLAQKKSLEEEARTW